MQLFRHISIQRKQTLIIMLTAGVALLLACIGFASYDLLTFRGAMVNQLSTLARIIGNNSTAALDFNDQKTAAETLSALRAQPNIVGAAVYTRAGKVFSQYQRPNAGIPFLAPPLGPPGHQFKGNALVLIQPIFQNREVVGTVYVESDLRQLASRLQQYALIVLLVFSAAALVSFVLSARLQRVISVPILQLAKTARRIAQQKEYSARALKQSEDELGVLVDSFNEMLCQIQHRDAELQCAKDALEQRVKERTAELAGANAALQKENLERKQAEETLRMQEERTRLIIDQAFDAVITTDIDFRVIGWNSQAEKTLGWSRTEMLGKELLETVIPHSRRQKRRDDLERFRATGAWPDLNCLVQTVAVHQDGREIPVEVTTSPIRIGGGHLFTIFLRDITQRKHAEAELDAAHRQLLETSRQAGMAEVATSVLHNVGNVLNSINVSASLVDDRIKKSRAADLTRLVNLLAEHSADLADFLTKDPKGKTVPAFLEQLAERLSTEQRAVLVEITSLRKNVEHVKDIISMQQSYARVSGVLERIEATELVEDTLRMNTSALARHEVSVVRQYNPAPHLCTDKHKVLQILVNLVRNAKYACDESGREDKQIIVSVQAETASVKIIVADNGVGIPQANLNRIFNYGFTTRKDGHGFGLHSGALAAKELGGSLTAFSDGPGRGAAFTLELPLPPKPANEPHD